MASVGKPDLIRCSGAGRLGKRSVNAPPSSADHAHDFTAAPNDLRVVTDIDHNVHTICDPKIATILHAPTSLSYVG